MAVAASDDVWNGELEGKSSSCANQHNQLNTRQPQTQPATTTASYQLPNGSRRVVLGHWTDISVTDGSRN